MYNNLCEKTTCICTLPTKWKLMKCDDCLHVLRLTTAQITRFNLLAFWKLNKRLGGTVRMYHEISLVFLFVKVVNKRRAYEPHNLY